MQTRFPILHETLSSYKIDNQDILPINEDIYDSLVNSISREDTAKAAQPSVIVGDSGCGKTFLIKRLYNTLKEDDRNMLYPVILEGKSLYSTNDIWEQCASSLNITSGEDYFNDILEWQDRQSKHIILFIDNVQYYFNRTDNTEHYGLRSKLNKAGAPILVASSEKVLPAFTEYDAAFFDGFKIIYFKPINVSNVKYLVNKEYDICRLEKMMDYLPQTIRSVLIANGIIENSNDSSQDISFLLDYFYYKYLAKFNTLTAYGQRILSALSKVGSGLNLAEIREMTGLKNGKISPYLTLMADQKIIIKTTATLRGGKYSILDPLFKLWLRHNLIAQ